jgi:gamma-glutamyl phosphate reductase
MTKTKLPQVKIVNVETGEEIIRDMNAEELEQHEANKAEAKAEEAIKAQKASEKASLLNRLGLTEDELKTILG